MYQVLDIGNTQIKSAFFDGDQLVARGLEGGLVAERAILSASGKVPEELVAMIGCPIHRLTCNSNLPIQIDYRTPETLGTDRIADACGAWKLFPGRSCMIVDAGTCMTIDLLDAEGHYQGGAILPGLEMRFKALHHYTAKLPEVAYCADAPLVGKDTGESILAGVVTAARIEVQGFLAQYRQSFPLVLAVLTGGDAEKLKFDGAAMAADLGLIGLNEILKLN